MGHHLQIAHIYGITLCQYFSKDIIQGSTLANIEAPWWLLVLSILSCSFY